MLEEKREKRLREIKGRGTRNNRKVDETETQRVRTLKINSVRSKKEVFALLLLSALNVDSSPHFNQSPVFELMV